MQNIEDADEAQEEETYEAVEGTPLGEKEDETIEPRPKKVKNEGGATGRSVHCMTKTGQKDSYIVMVRTSCKDTVQILVTWPSQCEHKPFGPRDVCSFVAEQLTNGFCKDKAGPAVDAHWLPAIRDAARSLKANFLA